MIQFRKRHTRRFLLLSLGAAAFFLFCHTLGAVAHSDGGFDSPRTVAAGLAYAGGPGLATTAECAGCEAALTGGGSFAGKPQAVFLMLPGPAYLTPSFPAPQAADHPDASPTVIAPHLTSLQRQAVLFRI